MKLPLLSFLFCLSTFQIAFAQIPKVYCTYWTGTQEILGTLNFTNQLNNNEAMSYMGMPYGPDCYFPRKDAVETYLE